MSVAQGNNSRLFAVQNLYWIQSPDKEQELFFLSSLLFVKFKVHFSLNKR